MRCKFLLDVSQVMSSSINLSWSPASPIVSVASVVSRTAVIKASYQYYSCSITHCSYVCVWCSTHAGFSKCWIVLASVFAGSSSANSFQTTTVNIKSVFTVTCINNINSITCCCEDISRRYVCYHSCTTSATSWSAIRGSTTTANERVFRCVKNSIAHGCSCCVINQYLATICSC